MNPRNTGHGRQNPSVNSKKKPDSEDREEGDDDEEEIATALDSKEVSHVHVDTDACDHYKQGLVVSRLVMYCTKVLMYRTMVPLAHLTKVRR